MLLSPSTNGLQFALENGFLAGMRFIISAVIATFTFTVSSEIAGQYVLPLRGVVDGAAWMDELGLYTVITVH